MPEAVDRNMTTQPDRPSVETKLLTRVIGVTTMALVLSGCQSLTLQDAQKPAPEMVTEKVIPVEPVDSSRIEQKVEETEQEVPVTDLWVRTRQGLGLNLDNNDQRILAELRWYRNNQTFFDRVTERASPYLYFIIQEAEKRDVPLELALLPVVESTYDPFAYSHAGASGLWQFMPATGEHYGLKQNWWYDGRRDIVAATRAALDYLVNLNKMFNDWELALAAFNSGPGRVLGAVKKNRKLKKPTDFWALDLPKETTAYVPKLVALGKIIRNPEKFGVKLKPVINKPYFAKVKTDGQLDMAKAARLSTVPLDKLYKLNPGINRWSTPPSGPHYLLVPIAKAQGFRTQLAELPMEKRLQWRRYSVESGDSLLRIANNFRTQVKLIKEVNKLDSNIIRIGQNLLIPVPARNREEYSLTSNQRRITRQSRKVSGRHRMKYQVQSGDSFWTIARKYNTGVNELARWNNLSPRDMLKIGQKLVVWTKTAATKDSVVRKVRYKVREGDSLARIADKFNVNVGQLKVWNSFDSKYIHPGQMITLFVDVTRSSR
ncbi:lytic transglycosylase [Endozoicomonas sp. OPT23]|uniref:LysM peptidoglycan-binding domain-containing protein n=1 Tax=Endozoicomonas sp. OPT23 TaxID=2072845 RepID=UPI00129A837E|nr:LysM peptidoglycan-binding domain-containing protein [Endozoicomonas sp. OPT23]MRI34172.1 lytic transglycosylase [Endozoicomonas sp. OPT23]